MVTLFHRGVRVCASIAFDSGTAIEPTILPYLHRAYGNYCKECIGRIRSKSDDSFRM